MAIVHELIHYPVKGCAGTRLPGAAVTPAGLARDRAFMVVDEHGQFISQRTLALLAVIQPTVRGDRLELSAPDIATLDLPMLAEGKRLPVIVWNHETDGIDQGDDAAEWFSQVLGRPCRLVGLPPDHQRATSGQTPGTAGFADGHAITVASLSSLDELNRRIVARGANPVPVDRFRPNIVIDGWPDPHTEDRVRLMTTGHPAEGPEFGYAKRDIRCLVTMIDQATGTSSGPEPLRTLADYRRDPEGGVSFCMKAAVTRPGTITVGDPIHVHTWGPGIHDNK